ncbi:hypothetical protein MTR67_013614 [Solanum verrucosum]|uniref:Secreted protein n=1 Tax=Solanum verrucosum TaxID=315347 RepID=A0AAF0TIK8_SOLVR|nr:hypothetical protein MTR67_013614 [Solanum verrucosum]
MFLQFVLAFSAYLHVLGTQFSQKFSSQCSVVQVLSIQITLRSIPDLQFSRISWWHLAKDAAWAFKDCVRTLYTQVYHFWTLIPNSIRQMMFNEFKTMCTWELRYNLVITTTFERRASARLSSWLKKVRNSDERPD